MAFVAGPIVAEFVAVVADDEGRCSATEKEKDGRELYDEKVV